MVNGCGHGLVYVTQGSELLLGGLHQMIQFKAGTWATALASTPLFCRIEAVDRGGLPQRKTEPPEPGKEDYPSLSRPVTTSPL
jgi:hypothetical protein